jgi:hypothetical protein
MCFRSFRLRQLNRPFVPLSFSRQGAASAHCCKDHVFRRELVRLDEHRVTHVPIHVSAKTACDIIALQACVGQCGQRRRGFLVWVASETAAIPVSGKGAVSKRTSGPDGLRGELPAPSNGGRNGSLDISQEETIFSDVEFGNRP